MTLWYLARAAGFTALFAATAAVVLGTLASGSRTSDPQSRDRRVLRQLAHRSAAVVTVAMLLLHVTLLVLDSFVDVSLSGALVPFTAGYRGVALGLGTLATYALVAVVVTGAARGRMAASAAGARGWRVVHLSAYVFWVLAMAHGMLAGTDSGTWWSWILYAACAVPVLVAGWIRVRVADVQHLAPLPTARRRLTSGGAR